MTELNESHLAKIAFEAYNEAKGGLTYDGKPIPPWDVIPQDVKDAWIAVAKRLEIAFKEE